MIFYIKGTLAMIQEEAVIVDVQGVGYEIIHSNPFSFQDSLHQQVTIYTYHHIREDAEVLYGFRTEDEKVLFTKLISVSGIGPKGALAIMGSADVSRLIEAVEWEDDAFLTNLPGIGKKTARQMILDLKGELSAMVSISEQNPANSAAKAVPAELQEAQEALKSLGYTDQEIKAVVPDLQKEDDQTTDVLIRKALSLLTNNQ
ncbi:Holliday junction DNA helicase RuvA [Barrientosiimonas marina]|uniref:Holliday junction branch migration complex subunit RuvA n=1 Tax=Lentibacillus kimchii TaxID=1542911 RepID=A0ABW2UY24_9BACI